MTEIRKSAVKIEQGKRTLFLTSFYVRDFFVDNFCRVDRLDVQESKGMQRLLHVSRAKSFGRDMVGADKQNEAFLPTSIFLATGGNISYDEETKELFFNPAEHAGVCPLDIVDGQHRIEGLKMVAEDNQRLMGFPVSVVIAHKLNEMERMLQFVTVNIKQQPVNKGVAQHIIARFTKKLEVEKLPYLPSWLRRQAEKGDDEKALDIARKLNSNVNSPWHGRIQFADQEKTRRHTINQATFVRSVKRLILSQNHPLNNFVGERQLSVLENFWKAIESIFVNQPEISGKEVQSVVFKYTGLEFFLSISAPIINQLAKNRNYTVDAMKKCILSAEDHLAPDAVEIMSPEYWERGSNASSLNRAGISKLVGSFADALAQANDGEIEV